MTTELHHHHDHHHETAPSGSEATHAEQATLLDLDAQLGSDFLAELTTWVADQGATPPRTIVDLGAGTGTGTLALAHRFSTARIVSVDSSPEMAARLRELTHDEGLADRVEVREADLDEAWPAPYGVDLVWAALSLHHAVDPNRLLVQTLDALAPGGLLVVIEMEALPRFLPDDLGFGRPGVEARCHALLRELNWNAHPDWEPSLTRAGFEPVEQRTFGIDSLPDGPLLARYARLFLTRIRSGLADRLGDDDLNALDRLLSPGNPESLEERADLTLHSPRAVWLARRPVTATNGETNDA